MNMQITHYDNIEEIIKCTTKRQNLCHCQLSKKKKRKIFIDSFDWIEIDLHYLASYNSYFDDDHRQKIDSLNYFVWIELSTNYSLNQTLTEVDSPLTVCLTVLVDAADHITVFDSGYNDLAAFAVDPPVVQKFVVFVGVVAVSEHQLNAQHKQLQKIHKKKQTKYKVTSPFTVINVIQKHFHYFRQIT